MWRSLRRIASCICEIRDIQQERLDVEKDILAELKILAGSAPGQGVAVRGVVTLGQPSEQ